MAKKESNIEQDYLAFLNNVPLEHRDFVEELNTALLAQGMALEIKAAKSGPVVTYGSGKPKRSLFNYVFRKSGMMMRIYGEHAGEYEDILAVFPEKMKAAIRKAGPCRRILDPAACSSRCSMGYVFDLDGEQQIKCRYNAFLLPVNEENKPHLRAFVEREAAARAAN